MSTVAFVLYNRSLGCLRFQQIPSTVYQLVGLETLIANDNQVWGLRFFYDILVRDAYDYCCDSGM